MLSFWGPGLITTYSPSAAYRLMSRGEFFTAYTPYQPELSQGTLQWIYELQTLVCN